MCMPVSKLTWTCLRDFVYQYSVEVDPCSRLNPSLWKSIPVTRPSFFFEGNLGYIDMYKPVSMKISIAKALLMLCNNPWKWILVTKPLRKSNPWD